MRIGQYQFGPPVVGIAFGSGSARGWAHIGVIHALEEAGIRPGIVTGTSAGAVVGSFYASRSLDRLESFVGQYKTVSKTIAHLDIGLGHAGIITGKRWLSKFLESYLPVRDFKQLSMPFGMVATDLVTMKEVHITSGPIVPAIRSTVAVPGFFSPYQSDDMLLVDGGILNPIPVNLAQMLGADMVIAVDLNAYTERLKPHSWGGVVDRSIETMMNRVRERNMASMKADVMITPDLTGINFLDFHKGEEAIEKGYLATVQKIAEIKRHLTMPVRRIPQVMFAADAVRREVGSWDQK